MGEFLCSSFFISSSYFFFFLLNIENYPRSELSFRRGTKGMRAEGNIHPVTRTVFNRVEQ